VLSCVRAHAHGLTAQQPEHVIKKHEGIGRVRVQVRVHVCANKCVRVFVCVCMYESVGVRVCVCMRTRARTASPRSSPSTRSKKIKASGHASIGDRWDFSKAQLNIQLNIPFV